MVFKPFKRVRTDDPNLELIQDSIDRTVTPIVKNYRLDSLILKKQQLIAGQDNTINHGLGRSLQGWLIVRIRDAQTNVWDEQDSNSTPNRTLILRCASDCVVDVEVF